MAINALLTHVPELLSWYRTVKRPFPWREERPDPYRVWISEVMSHQSTMATVLPYFQRWVEKFPTLERLAAAEEAEVVAAWAGLGYYSRARNVLKAACALADYREHHGGAWPRTAAEWLVFPGIGPYSAAAIAAICFDDAVLPLDGNVIRVLARVEGLKDPLNSPSERREVESRLNRLAEGIALRTHGETAQALMELGALVCRPGVQAKCLVCPLKGACQAFKSGQVGSIPKPKARPEAHKVTSLALVYRDKKGSILLRKIPRGKRLAGQWEIPLWELPSSGTLAEVASRFEVAQRPVKHLITKYVYSVHRVEAGAWTGEIPEEHVFWNPEQTPPGTITTLTRKILLI